MNVHTVAATTTSSDANSRQVGGQHYKTGGIEHWDVMHDADVPYLLGCASKYVARHDRKDGDGRLGLEKAVHYMEKWNEKVGTHTSFRDWRVVGPVLVDWCAAAEIRGPEQRVLYYMLCRGDFDDALQHTRELIALRYPEPEMKISGKEEMSMDHVDWTHTIHKPGTPEDGGHHARQAPDVVPEDVDEDLIIPNYTEEDIHNNTLPDSLNSHEYVHRCAPEVQRLYVWSVSAARYLLAR